MISKTKIMRTEMTKTMRMTMIGTRGWGRSPLGDDDVGDCDDYGNKNDDVDDDEDDGEDENEDDEDDDDDRNERKGEEPVG